MSSQMAQLQEATIKAQCKSLRMPMIASQFGTLAEQAIREKKSHIGYLEALLLAEIEERERNTIERRIREAHLPRLKTLEEFDYTQSPNVTAANERILREGGTSSWRLDRNHARQCVFAVCTRNANADWVEGSEAHHSAFLVGKISDVVAAPDYEGRYLIQFSEFARVNIPDAWKGDRLKRFGQRADIIASLRFGRKIFGFGIGQSRRPSM